MTRRRKTLLPILIALLSLLLIFLAGRLFRQGAREIGNPPETSAKTLETMRLPPDACDLSQTSCRVELPGGGILTAELTPRPLATLQPLTARLTVRDIPAESALLTLSGVNMNMPFDPAPLWETAPGQFVGQTTLPICVTGPMRWRAEFSVIYRQRQLIAEFLFDAQ
ncbi:MAG: hypothetical protein LBJ59_04890 [Zoogloeaceae bacterium]|jgi:hypothetical protein|nr:hypothetical protein [Zoogloeaceae bacterium]